MVSMLRVSLAHKAKEFEVQGKAEGKNRGPSNEVKANFVCTCIEEQSKTQVKEIVLVDS